MNEKEFPRTRYPDLFSDDEAADPALVRLIDELETVYAAVNRPANLSEQLVSTLQSHLEQADPTAELPAASLPERPISIRRPRGHSSRGWQRGLGRLAAAVLIALIAGSLLLVLRQAHQPGPNKPGTGIYKTTGLNRFLSIHMLDTTTGWAQISDGLIARFVVLRTTDGGSHWQDVTPPQLTTPVNDNLAQLYALNATTAWVTDTQPVPGSRPIRYHGVLFRTKDAGQTWQSIALPSSVPDDFSLSKIQFLNAQVGWITIESHMTAGKVQDDYWQTNNGGQTWSNITISIPTGNNGVVTFLDAQTWWFTDDTPSKGQPVIFVTHDAGATWHQHVLPVPAGVVFASPFPGELIATPQVFSARDGLLTVGSEDIVVYATYDGGDTWQPTTPVSLSSTNKNEGNPFIITPPVFADMKHGLIWEEFLPLAGTALPTTNHLLITIDGGQHWTPISLQMPGGQKGQSVSLDNVWNSWHNPDFVSAQVGWLIGYYSPPASEPIQNVLFKTVDGGHTWTSVHYSIS
jgi:photosystem II stability/assembly factor-like uncharacterized protein